MRRIAQILLLCLIAASCERNHKPVIAELNCLTDSRSAGTIFTLRVLASDVDGDIITYYWKADEGTFTTLINDREVSWKSPVNGAGKIFDITVFVSDGKNQVSRTFQIQLGEPDLGSLSGQANFTNFKIPIPSVNITIGGKTATTDVNGKFFVAGIPAIEDTLFAAKQDYSTAKSVITILANDTIGVTIELTSVNLSTKLSGVVTDQDGLLLDNTKVAILNPDGSLSKLITTTDEAGFYRLWYIPFGDRTISVAKDETADASYAYFKKTVNFNDPETQLIIVIQKTSYSGTFTDGRDQHEYDYKKIGSYYWMTENLAYLPVVNPPSEISYKESRYYVYGYSGADSTAAIAAPNYEKYGVLYNWTAQKTACPPGWRVPSSNEWSNLFYFLGDNAAAKMKSVSDWNGHGGGSNSSGLNVYPAGQMTMDGVFSRANEAAYLWTSTLLGYTQPGFSGLTFDSDQLSLNRGSEKMGCSIRCIRN